MHASGRSRVLRAVTMAAAVIIGATACESSSSSTTPAPAATTTTSSTTTSTTTTTTVAATAANSCAGGGTCAVGDTGPGGGVVFYSTTKSFNCGADRKSQCNALEAAPDQWAASLSGFSGCSNYEDVDPKCRIVPSSGTTYTEVRDTGAAQFNTAELVKIGATSEAAGLVQAYRGGGKSDWGIPSFSDLVFLCTYFRGGDTAGRLLGCTIGTKSPRIALLGETYLSSSFYGGNVVKHTMIQQMNLRPDDGDNFIRFGHGETNAVHRVRPVRAFLAATPPESTTTVKATTTTVRATTTTVKATTTTVAASTTTAAPTTTTTTSTTTTLAPTTTVATCAQGGTCVVGDTGPGGGTVYYVSANGFSCGVTMSSTCHYLEVSPANWKASTASSANCTAAGTENVECVWASASLSTFIDTSGAVGNGAKNTKAIIDGVGVLNSWAAVVSKAYQGGGKSDWFLPSQHELDELCKFANGQTTGDQSVACARGTLKTGFYPGNYWSSNDGGSGKAISIDLMHGVQAFPSKDLARLIRPVRAF